VSAFSTLVWLGLKRMWRYPWSLLASVAISPIVLLLNVTLFTTLYRYHNSQDILGYRLTDMIWYFAATTFIWFLIYNFTDRSIARRVIDGDFARDLLRPVSVFAWELGFAVALRLAAVALEFVPSLVLYSLLVPPDFLTAGTLLRFLIATVVAFLLFFVMNFLIGLAGVYLQGPNAILAAKHVLVSALAGALIPLEFFPAGYQRVLHASPFPYLFYWPIQFFLGRDGAADWPDLVRHQAVAVAWLFGLFAAAWLLWRRAIRRYTDAGG
jgi:ABC-2 type transport system permease protein